MPELTPQELEEIRLSVEAVAHLIPDWLPRDIDRLLDHIEAREAEATQWFNRAAEAEANLRRYEAEADDDNR